jgi:nucleotide-binding universal stress UspA family protein
MLLDPKTVAVFLDASPTGKKRAAHAAVLAHRWGAHLIGVHVVFAGVTWPPSMDYARGDAAIEQVIAYKHQLDSEAEAVAIRVGEHFRGLCGSLNVSGEFRRIGRENSAEEAIRIAFHSDLIVVGRPEPHGLPDDMSAEKLLLASGTPTLIVPNSWKGEAIGNKILIGWNATRQARRAVADSMPFLVAAKSVTVLVIDPGESNQRGEDPGSDITLHLDRHGAHVNLEQVASQGFSVAAAMLGYAEQSASDLLVVGAYSHARAREFLIGGTTRTLLAQTPMPTFISR